MHGDYDVDGICATALAVLTLRELGADVTWHLPSRFDEGYGVSASTVERLAADGVQLILTVDCGITAAAEVDEARRLGVDVIVSDHHRPGEELPACPIVATRPSEYPFPDLCGTGVVAKLAQALLGPEHPAVTRHADLVALATIADVVPLVDENRALATTGLRGLARTQKPGLRALMRVAGVDPGHGRRDRGRVPAGTPAQRGRPPRASRCRPAPRPDRGRARGGSARERDRAAQPRPPGGRGADHAGGSRGRRGLARGETQARVHTSSGVKAGTRA